MKGFRLSYGFTLIELVVVIVILGILAATALPKFIDVGKDARVATLEGLKGTLASAAEMARMKCIMTSGCDLTGDSGAPLTIDNSTGKLWWGYPIDSTRNGYLGIDDVVNLSGFTHSVVPPNAYFDKDGAPTPSACRVTYFFKSDGSAPTITATTTGC